MKKDYKKILKSLYAPKPYIPTIVTAPRLNFLMVSGSGLPHEEAFQKAAETLFPVAYVAKFLVKAQKREEDFVVMPMEVKWKLNRSQHGSRRYFWTMMIMQPACVNIEVVNEAKKTLLQKKKELPFESRLRLEVVNEGLCGQILHIGPYKQPMEQCFGLLTKELKNQNYEWEPDSHDIYFNDSRNTPPEKLKTIIRTRIWKKDAPREDTVDPFLEW